jgi:uncharacterized glyoxalase superfamily protein PhnB
MVDSYQTVIPMLAYENGLAAMEWLAEAFGFQELVRMINPDGILAHGEMMVNGNKIMLATPTPDYESPAHHRQHCETARKWSEVPWVIDGVMVHVDDIDAHFERARAAGAKILTEIQEDAQGRRYRAEDLEGHRWFFLEREKEGE